jgi:hypothetical protein
VPCPKGKELETSDRKLGDLVSGCVPSGLLDGTAELLDDINSEVSKNIQGDDRLVVVEGYCHFLSEEKDPLEHIDCIVADSCLNKGQVLLRVFCFFSVIVVIS